MIAPGTTPPDIAAAANREAEQAPPLSPQQRARLRACLQPFASAEARAS